jgi:16S rRNA processing protein RimM
MEKSQKQWSLSLEIERKSYMGRVTIGRISRARGVKGEMVVVPFTDDPRRFGELKKVMILKGEVIKDFLVEEVRQFKGKVLLKLKGVEKPEEVKKLVGGFIEIEREQMVELPPGRYFVFDLIGLEVITTGGARIGKVKDVLSLPANDLYLVEGGGKEHHIPALKEVVKKIDLKKKEMIIEPIEGLLDL